MILNFLKKLVGILKRLIGIRPKQVRYPTSFQCVDVVPRDLDKNQILLVRKHYQDRWRFLGGFVDPQDASLEAAAHREKNEEAGINLELSNLKYLFSYRVDDPRYRDSEDKIMTAVFLGEYLFGPTQIGDAKEIAETSWTAMGVIKNRYEDFIVPEHWELVRGLIEEGVI